MQSLSKVDVSIEKYFHKILSELLLNNLPLGRDQLANIKDCLQEYAHFQQNFMKDWTRIADHKKHRNFDEEIKKFKEHELLLHEFVFKGPTNDPQLFDPKFMEVIHEKMLMKKSIVKEFLELKATYQTEVNEPLVSFKFIILISVSNLIFNRRSRQPTKYSAAKSFYGFGSFLSQKRF